MHTPPLLCVDIDREGCPLCKKRVKNKHGIIAMHYRSTMIRPAHYIDHTTDQGIFEQKHHGPTCGVRGTNNGPTERHAFWVRNGLRGLHAEVHNGHKAGREARSDAILSEIPRDLEYIALALDAMAGARGTGMNGGRYRWARAGAGCVCRALFKVKTVCPLGDQPHGSHCSTRYAQGDQSKDQQMQQKMVPTLPWSPTA